MKLNPDFVLYDMGDEHTLVATGAAAEKFRGIARCNRTAAFIIEQLQNGIEKDALISSVEAGFEGGRAEIETSVENVLKLLRSIGALEE